MTERELTTLWLAATRYYLGRTSYAVSDYCELLRARWAELPSSLHAMLMRDIEAEFDRDDEDRELKREHRALGMDTERMQWEKVRRLWGAV